MFEIGDKVWNINVNWDSVEEVEITSLPIKGSTTGVVCYEINGAKQFVLESNLYKTEEEAIAGLKQRKEERVDKMSSQIHNVSDLLYLMFEGMCFDRRINYERIEVAKRKAKELLGVELNR